MSDLISRAEAIDDLHGKDPSQIWDTADIEVWVNALPPAQPERKRGKWHQRFYSKVEMMVCSECGNEFSYDAETGLRDYNFCPNCGAEMREASND